MKRCELLVEAVAALLSINVQLIQYRLVSGWYAISFNVFLFGITSVVLTLFGVPTYSLSLARVTLYFFGNLVLSLISSSVMFYLHITLFKTLLKVFEREGCGEGKLVSTSFPSPQNNLKIANLQATSKYLKRLRCGCVRIRGWRTHPVRSIRGVRRSLHPLRHRRHCRSGGRRQERSWH